jgi:hypothetical protein
MFKNPNYINLSEKAAAERYVKYKPKISAFIADLPSDQEFLTFEQVRESFRQDADPEVAVLADRMTDGLLQDLCSRHGLDLF